MATGARSGDCDQTGERICRNSNRDVVLVLAGENRGYRECAGGVAGGKGIPPLPKAEMVVAIDGTCPICDLLQCERHHLRVTQCFQAQPTGFSSLGVMGEVANHVGPGPKATQAVPRSKIGYTTAPLGLVKGIGQGLRDFLVSPQ